MARGDNQAWITSVTASASWFRKKAKAAHVPAKRHRGLLVWLVEVRTNAAPLIESRTIGVQARGVPRLLFHDGPASTSWAPISRAALGIITCDASPKQVREDFQAAGTAARIGDI